MRAQAWCLVAVVAFGALPSRASAYDDEVTVGLELGWAGIPNANRVPPNGIDLGLTVGYGVNDAWAVRGLGSFNLLFGDRRLRTGIIGAEAIYLLDIVRFVPLFGFGVDAMVSGFDGRTRGDFAMHALLGIDFLISRRWLIGVDGRGFWITTNGKSFMDALFFTVAARVGIRFGVH